MSERVSGYLLLIGGIALITFAVVNVYFVFTDQMKPFPLFDFPSIGIDLSSATEISLSQELQDSGVTIGDAENQTQELLPGEVLSQTSNIIAHLILMGFLVNAGYKLASLGTQLLRPIVVKVKPNSNSILVPQTKST